MKFKKAQSSANSAAITLIVITVVIVLYILFLPPADREALLNNGDSSTEPSASRPLVLVDEFIGRLNFVPDSELGLDLQSFNLRTLTSAEVVASKSNLYVKNSLFDNIDDTLTFNINPELAEDLIVTFNAVGKGRLEVLLNDKRIFFGEIDGNSPPIYIDNSDLRNSNTLKFLVSSPGLVFWSYNYYDISNLRVVGDVTDITRSFNTQTMSLSERDAVLLSTARLRYLATCNPGQVSNFEIKVNHNTVFRGIPDCNIFNHISLSREDLYPGVNYLEFSIDDGTITIDQLRLLKRLEIPDNPLFIFDVDEKYFYENETLRQNREAELNLRFTNPDRKRLEIFLNGRFISVNVADSVFTRDVSSYLVPGSNSLEVRALQTVDITELKVELK
ncbi:MAG: hypothetical protein ACMXX9_00700 [Candidatus Woesearchaeota archaeon]